MATWRLSALWAACLVLGVAGRGSAQGIMLSAGGPVHRSMGGASTAAPLDAIGALYWNPATTSGLDPEVSFGLDFLLPVIETSSSVAGLGSGTTGGEPGVAAIPNVGWVHRAEGSCITYGLGVLGLAGFATNYPASTTNPVFLPQSNAVGTPGGLGRVFTKAQFLQIAPTVSLALTDQWSIGIGPTINLAELIVDPLLIAPFDDQDGSGVPRYGSGSGTRTHWGGGAQLGVYFICENGWHLGASIKSPQWFEEFRYHSEDELGNSVTHRYKIDLPMVISLGTAYSGFDNVVLALDVRYFDYRNTDGFGGHGFGADGTLLGLGASNIMAVATGVQYRLTECLYLRTGYTWNQSLFQDWEATSGVPAPIYYQHQFAVGSSVRVSRNVWLNVSYTYYVDNSLTGPILTPAGAVPGGSLTTRVSAHDAAFGVTVQY